MRLIMRRLHLRGAEYPDRTLTEEVIMDGYGKRILVVDDEEATRKLVAIVLERADYTVVPVCDALDALVELKRRHFDAVVTNLSMPIIDGVELLGHIHAAHPEVPVILVSGDLPDSVLRTEASAFFACLRKPFENAVLLELVRAAAQTSETACAENTLSAPMDRS